MRCGAEGHWLGDEVCRLWEVEECGPAPHVEIGGVPFAGGVVVEDGADLRSIGKADIFAIGVAAAFDHRPGGNAAFLRHRSGR